MAKEWFVMQDGKAVGPMSTDKLKALSGAGRINQDSLISDRSDGPWHPAMKVKGLVLAAPASTSQEAKIPQMQSPPPPTTASRVSRVSEPVEKAKTERIVWSGHPSHITNIKTFIVCGLFCWLIVPVFVALWRYLVVRTSRYELTNQRFRSSHGVLARATDELELYRIKDTTFSQTLFQRFFGLATVSMTTSDSSALTVEIDSIPAAKAKELRESIRTFVEELRDRKRVREMDFN